MNETTGHLSPSPHTHRRTLLWLLGFLGVSAVLGGFALLIDVINLPENLLDGSPFSGYDVPSLILVLVGMLALGAFIAVRAERQAAAPLSSMSGGAIVVFELVEIWVIGVSWLQFVYLAVGVALLVLSVPLVLHSRDVPARASHI
jgi:hypothetical protein